MSEQETKFLNPVPLIPPLEKPACPDTSHIIREEFQKIIGADEFPEQIAQNLARNQIENEYLLQCGLVALKAIDNLKAQQKDITEVELSIMESQAVYLIHSAYKEMNPNSLYKIYPEISPDMIERYSLLHIDNIYPNMYKRILSNKLPPFRFIYKHPCPVEESIELLDICCGKPNMNLTDQQKMQLKHLQRRSQYEQMKILDFPCKKSKYFNQMVFDWHPKKIVFRNFELFKVYEQKLVLKNITTHLQHLVIPRIPKYSSFYIIPCKIDPRVAPGMRFTFTIGFKAELVENKYEHLVIKVIGSQPIHIDVNSYKDMPFLKGLVYHKDFMEGNITIDKEKSVIYNHTIDCGTVLYGCRSECNFMLQNTGGTSRFFLISEIDWYRQHITCLTDTYRLILPDFKIYPAYFTLDKNEICEMKIEFCPREEGLALDKLFLISENNNIEEIDVFGDCIYYEPHFFRFEMPECPTNGALKSDSDIRNVLLMGATYYEQTIIAHFYMYNRSLISIPYECRMEELPGDEYYRVIKKEWVEIIPECGTILPLTGERFTVTLKMRSKKTGLYKFVLNVFAIDIPEVSLMEGPIFTYEEEYRSKDLKQKLLTVLIDKVEVQIHHIKIPIRIYPDVVTFPKLIYKGPGVFSNIQIVNEGFCCLPVEWYQTKKNNKKVKIKLKPNKFVIESMKSVSCSIMIKVKTYDDIKESITLSVNNGLDLKTIPVVGRVEKPRMKVTDTFVNFGHVKIQANVSHTLRITNLSETCLCWQVKEFQYDYEIHQFMETDNSSLSTTKGKLCQENNETQIVYTLDTTAPRKFLSILIFFTIYKYEKYESTHVILLGYIHEPKVRIEATYNGEDIFKIEDIYYVHESVTKTFELHNDAVVSANYSWGAPSGFHIKHLHFAFDSNKGVLYPNSRKYVNITLIFKKPGIIFDFYIPCYIQYISEPLILQVLCVIKRPQVMLQLPIDTEPNEIAWPADFEPASEICGEATLLNYIADSDSKLFDFNNSLSSQSSVKNKVPYPSAAIDWNIDHIFDYLHQIELDGEQQKTTTEQSQTESIKSETISEISRPSEIGLFSKFASETSICEYVVYLNNVKLKEVCTRTFSIKNPMTYPLKYAINVKHFKAKDFKRKRLENLYINLKWKSDDSYTKQLSDYGIMVSVEPSSGILIDHGELTLTITAYAETWGYYLDEISVELEHIPIFYMNLVVQVIGQPIDLPMLITSKYFIQFSNIQKCTFEQKRLVFVHNNSTIPCTIVWHVFLNPTKAQAQEDHDHDKFNIVYDVYGFDSESQIGGNVKVIKYIGTEIPKSFKLFRVEPNELYLDPRQTRQICVYFKPMLCEEAQLDLSNIRVTIIGNIYIEKKNRHTNFLIRDPNKDLQMITIPVRTFIPEISLDLQCIRGEKDMVISVNDLLNGNLKWKNMRLVFRNNCKSDIVVSMSATEPFEVISIRSRISENNKTFKAYTRIPVLAEGYVEAIIKCEVLKEHLLDIADLIYKNENNNLTGIKVIGENCVKVNSTLKIKHVCNESQSLPISVILYFPLIQVSSTTLDFGTVCIGSKKHLTLKISNKTASKTWIGMQFIKHDKNFKCDESEVFLKPHTICPKSLYLTITFSPNSIPLVEDTLRIRTKLPQYYIDVTVTGLGTYDEKYFFENVIKVSK